MFPPANPSNFTLQMFSICMNINLATAELFCSLTIDSFLRLREEHRELIAIFLSLRAWIPHAVSPVCKVLSLRRFLVKDFFRASS